MSVPLSRTSPIAEVLLSLDNRKKASAKVVSFIVDFMEKFRLADSKDIRAKSLPSIGFLWVVG